MRTLKRILLGLLTAIALIIIAGLIYLNSLKYNALPDYNQDVELNGLNEEVLIYRDTFAIPHIFAKNEADLYVAVGYVMAQDRLWQMDLLRRVTIGRLSEIFGADMIETDLLLRSLRIPDKSLKLLETADSEILKTIESFADGINQYIRNKPLPPEFKILGYEPEPWKPEHSLNLIGYMSWDLTSGWGSEILLSQLQEVISESKLNMLIPDPGKYPTPVLPDFYGSDIEVVQTILDVSKRLKKLGTEIFAGSNNWAVSPLKSKTGKPLLANDMHLGLAVPGIWYQMHQVIEGKLNVTGVILPGAPAIVCGHNDSIAWGMTNVSVDNLDFYREKFNEDSTKYLFNNEWRELLIKEETIKIKGGDQRKFKLMFTHRGPIVNRFKNVKGDPISIRWIGNEMSNEMRTIYKLNRARNWEDFRDAVKTFVSISQNVVYADVNGNIGLQTSAGIPIREGNGISIYPGDTSQYDWKGIVPFEELPYEYNPDRGYVSSANNKTVPDDYPYYISSWFSKPYRIDRIREMLDEKEVLGPDDIMDMHADTKSKLADWILPYFMTSLETEKQWNELQSELLKKLNNWNGRLLADSPEGAVFEILYRKVNENMIKDDLPEELYKKLMGDRGVLENLLTNILPEKTSEWIDDKTTPEKESFDDIVIRSYKETIDELTSLCGNNPEKWNWGEIHTLFLNHPLGSVKILDKAFNLNRGPFKLPGSTHTVCPYSYNFNDLYKINHGASQRHIFDLSNWDTSKTVIPTGNSGIPSSPFYCNQTKLYINNQYHNDPFSLIEVRKVSRYEMKLVPDRSIARE